MCSCTYGTRQWEAACVRVCFRIRVAYIYASSCCHDDVAICHQGLLSDVLHSNVDKLIKVIPLLEYC